MSLLFGDEFEDKTDLTGYDSAFYNLFNRCITLTDASNLILPATTLASNCYRSMFQGCANLTTSPKLPATILENGCYNSMFMSCNKLNHITMLAADISASSCLAYWLYGASSTGTFVKSPYMTSLPLGYGGIPNGWTTENYEVSTPCIVNLTKNNDISFYYADGLFTPTTEYIQLTQYYSEQQILSFKPQCDIIVDIYTKDNNIEKSINWSTDMSLFDLINGLGIDNINNLAIHIKSIVIPEVNPYYVNY